MVKMIQMKLGGLKIVLCVHNMDINYAFTMYVAFTRG
jgi:hypothetical protein